jgi:hypothetical protein
VSLSDWQRLANTRHTPSVAAAYGCLCPTTASAGPPHPPVSFLAPAINQAVGQHQPLYIVLMIAEANFNVYEERHT